MAKRVPHVDPLHPAIPPKPLIPNYRCPLCNRELKPLQGKPIKKMFGRDLPPLKYDVRLCESCYKRVALKVLLLDRSRVRLRRLAMELDEAVEEMVEGKTVVLEREEVEDEE